MSMHAFNFVNGLTIDRGRYVPDHASNHVPAEAVIGSEATQELGRRHNTKTGRRSIAARLAARRARRAAHPS